MKQCCKTCKFSRFNKTEKGNIIRNRAGLCVVTFNNPALPDCICPPNYHRMHIWPDMGIQCPAYEELAKRKS